MIILRDSYWLKERRSPKTWPPAEAKPIPEALAQYGTFDMDEKLVKQWLGGGYLLMSKNWCLGGV